MNRRVDAEVRAIRAGWGYGYAIADGRAESAGMADPAPQAGGASSAAPAPAHSETETQVKGVDEADIVKTDGNHIYLLHGDKFLVVDSWPATNLGTAASVTIEGQPLEMFVADGRAVVFSRVDGTPIYAGAHLAPRPRYSDGYGYGYAGGGAAIGAPAPGFDGPVYSNYGSYANALTKITVLALAGTQASVTRELYFEGSYLSSRRVGGKVRAVLNGGAHGPKLAYSPTYPSPQQTSGPNGAPQYVPPAAEQQIAAWEALRAKNDLLISQTSYADWVPSSFAKSGDAISVTPARCEDYYVPTSGTTEFGMTQIESIDLDAPTSPPRETTIVGSATTVYGNASALVLASAAYVDPWVLRSAYPSASTTSGPFGTTQPQAIPVQTLNYTHLHVFDTASDPSSAQYAGSGTVPGSVKDQFALDEKNGFVRVTTTEQRSGPPRADGKSNGVNHVYVLENDRGSLRISGDAGEIAPGEQLYATRYVGDKAYIVTWHVTDPLFVVDVADPRRPSVLGQVEIPGFSTYIHPLDDTHLLTIGRETDDAGHQHTNGGYWYGLAIQVFDVTNPLQPKQQYKYVYDGGEYATSEAMTDHKAFTYFEDKKLLAFPYVHQGRYGSYAPSSTLEVFKVGVAEGITKVGAVDHSSLLGTLPNGNYGYCGGYFDGAVRRGVFVENVVYSISYGGIVASEVSTLASAMNTLKLSAPTLQNACK